MIQPCKNCMPPKRHPGCHSTCPDYILEQKKRTELNEKIRNEKINTYDICEGIGRMYKNRGRKKKDY